MHLGDTVQCKLFRGLVSFPFPLICYAFMLLQVKPQNYPNILVTAGLNGMSYVNYFVINVFCFLVFSLPAYVATDPRVLYSEPAKFVAKLREMKTDDNILVFKCELGAGHFSKSGR